MTIKRGVSLYSYQNETFLGKMSLEDCIRTTVGFGADGIEVIGEQTFWGWPEAGVADEKIAEWHHLINKYDAVPVCHDFMLDYKRYKGREMPFAEQVASVRKDIEFAARLGVKYVRALVAIAPEVLVAAAPYAEEKGIKILIEVHAPLHFDHPWIVRHAEAFEKSGSDALGFLPDMGMFLFQFPPVWKERFIRNGVPQNIADYITKAYEDRVLSEYVILNVREMGGVGPAIAMAETLRHNAAFEPKRMLDYMHRIHNVHGKFYQMDEKLVEPSIPYDEIVQVLKQGNYDGYICSEYEGNRWIEDAYEVDSVEQVRRHQDMLKQLIDVPANTTIAA
ncbi:sugar phosphate isomerase/epimerase [Sphingomonas sp. SORGH_AS870]|uniref:sugar phosphate isomerase/epimerase family protein n=1 Tax=Sphingomonas sp. SORGH_AS_0870 TaxID=3041801 RepID=UPI002858DB22|nr:TIM barrel protein [Sphingomonas sp. SORGH_AS_0870]MDR6147809.1 sugar phosphate isomerase/epimerase [Sphingomonas sp. SORGH_AS_0870]